MGSRLACQLGWYILWLLGFVSFRVVSSACDWTSCLSQHPQARPRFVPQWHVRATYQNTATPTDAFTPTPHLLSYLVYWYYCNELSQTGPDAHEWLVQPRCGHGAVSAMAGVATCF